ncbi:MAG: hypothetical protein ACR5LG_07220 [Sodalis sp. (in: enterobacteria)]|uniref:hypothetical protein n=1 Tax=Sodalis sp. (in: enterobacteria) TaxID=1898979 RepID=UPI003F2EBDDE
MGGAAPATRQRSAVLAQTLRGLDINDYILIGYSLGGRRGLYHSCHGQDPRLRALYVEGAHPGLADAPACRQRVQHDMGVGAALCRRPAGGGVGRLVPPADV